jgi:hypothetical protein
MSEKVQVTLEFANEVDATMYRDALRRAVQILVNVPGGIGFEIDACRYVAGEITRVVE